MILSQQLLSLDSLSDRLSTEQLSYIKLSLTLGKYFVDNWLYTFPPLPPRILPPISLAAPCICSRCGTLLGGCIGGNVIEVCFNCYSAKTDNEVGNATNLLKKWAYPSNIDYELAIVLKEIYHGCNSVLQCSNNGARKRINDIGNNA